MKLDLKIFVLAIVATGILGYAYARTADLIRGPRVFITAPEDGATVDSSLVEVRGTVKNAASFTINGRVAEINTKGEFGKTVLLAKGWNAIKLSAEDKFGRTVTKQ